MAKGNKYGTHRVIEPKGLLPQAATRIDSSMEIYDNEILINVKALNIDSASFTQLWEEAKHDEEALKKRIKEIVGERGKMQNPVTGSGGMLIGEIAQIGPDLKDRDLKVGDKIATLVSLSLTPLHIEEIVKVYPEIDRVEIVGQAVLFESGIYARLPEDMSENLALAALDVAGAPAQTAKLVKPGNKVLVLGAGGKSGMMVCYEARKQAGENGLVVASDLLPKFEERLVGNKFADKYIACDATNAGEVLEKALAASGGVEYDVAINVVNVPGTEMSTILPVRDGGIVYFFSMATSFTRAALGAEGVGKDVDMLIGNGYTKGHADHTLNVLRESPELTAIFEELYL